MISCLFGTVSLEVDEAESDNSARYEFEEKESSTSLVWTDEHCLLPEIKMKTEFTDVMMQTNISGSLRLIPLLLLLSTVSDELQLSGNEECSRTETGLGSLRSSNFLALDILPLLIRVSSIPT